LRWQARDECDFQKAGVLANRIFGGSRPEAVTLILIDAAAQLAVLLSIRPQSSSLQMIGRSKAGKVRPSIAAIRRPDWREAYQYF